MFNSYTARSRHVVNLNEEPPLDDPFGELDLVDLATPRPQCFSNRVPPVDCFFSVPAHTDLLKVLNFLDRNSPQFLIELGRLFVLVLLADSPDRSPLAIL